MNSMFETLVELPLFKGVSIERMTKTVGTYKFHFLKYLPGETIFRAGEPCIDLAFIISGTIRITIENSDERFSVSQSLAAPDVISSEFLFGKLTTYPGTIKALDTVSILRISKSDYIKILNSDPIFLFNYLNLIAMGAQKSVEGVMRVSSGDIRQRIAFWVSALTQPRSFDIQLECKQRDLVSLFGIARSYLKDALEYLRQKDLIDYTPKIISVKDRRKLLAELYDHAETPDN